MADERNFRTYYYEKFGIGGVEERKSIEILLKERPLSVEKLKQFSLRFPVPAVYRSYLWKVILGILPINPDSHEFVMKQRTQKYQDLHHALQVMRLVQDDIPLGQVFLLMYLLESGLLTFEKNKLNDPDHLAFISMATSVSCTTEDDVDAYWTTVQFYRLTQRCKEGLHQMVEKTGHCLKKEDTDQKLWSHLSHHDVLNSLPLSDWFRSCFAEVLPNSSFERIWDKIIGGSLTILAYVAVAIFLTFKRPLLSMNKTEVMIKYLNKIPEDSGNIVVMKAVELWQKHGGHLIQSKSVARRATSLTFTRDESDILVADKSGDVYKFSVSDVDQDGQLLLGHLSMLLDIVTTNDDRYVVTCDRDEKIRISSYPNAYNIRSFCLHHTEFGELNCR